MIFQEEVKAIIPVGTITEVEETFFKDKDWTPSRIQLTKDELRYETKETKETIPLRSIYYLDRQVNFKRAMEHNVITFNYTTSEGSFLALIKTSSRNKLKRRILEQIMVNTTFQYIIEYQVGDTLYEEKEWKKGSYRGKGTRHIQMLSENKRLTAIPRKDILFVTTADIKGRPSLEIYYEKNKKVVVSVLSPSDTSLYMVLEYFKSCFLRDEQSIPTLSRKELKVVNILTSVPENSSFLASEISDSLDIEMDTLENIIDSLREKKVVEKEEIVVKLSTVGDVLAKKKSSVRDEDIEIDEDRLEEIVNILSKLRELKEKD